MVRNDLLRYTCMPGMRGRGVLHVHVRGVLHVHGRGAMTAGVPYQCGDVPVGGTLATASAHTSVLLRIRNNKKKRIGRRG